MVRKVNGFLTANGKYFETREQAALYEASFKLEHVLNGFFSDVPEVMRKFLIDKVRIFLHVHRDEVKEYGKYDIPMDMPEVPYPDTAPVTEPFNEPVIDLTDMEEYDAEIHPDFVQAFEQEFQRDDGRGEEE